jgi:hypothetical protein
MESWRRIESYRLEYGQNSIPAQLPVSFPILNQIRFSLAPRSIQIPSIRIPTIKKIIKLIVDTLEAGEALPKFGLTFTADNGVIAVAAAAAAAIEFHHGRL